ncbi:hypothetical protein [Leisingera daeponensis]|nr:hypothetical protein [Leisingera daeponensis]MBY6057957.1 hypothetical protein [Leisingera daeponensis]
MDDFLRRPQQDHPAAAVVDFLTAVPTGITQPKGKVSKDKAVDVRE